MMDVTEDGINNIEIGDVLWHSLTGQTKGTKKDTLSFTTSLPHPVSRHTAIHTLAFVRLV